MQQFAHKRNHNNNHTTKDWFTYFSAANLLAPRAINIFQQVAGDQYILRNNNAHAEETK